jgi:hypothetical protein
MKVVKRTVAATVRVIVTRFRSVILKPCGHGLKVN